MTAVKDYTVHIDSKKRITLRGALYQYYNVKEYDNSRLLYVYDEEPLNIVEMSDSTVDAVTKGMHDLTVSGSVAFAFQDCVVSAGAKTVVTQGEGHSRAAGRGAKGGLAGAVLRVKNREHR